jgi:TPR repeat protein
MQKRSTSDGFNNIPENVAAVVFSHLGKNPRHRIRLAAVSKVWRDAEKSDLSLPGAPRALFELGEDLIGKETKVSFRKAFYWYRKAADLGDADAMWMIGVCYRSGLGVKKDKTKAFEWWEKASLWCFHRKAICSLAMCYQRGDGVEKNKAMAFELYLRAAEQGSAEAA